MGLPSVFYTKILLYVCFHISIAKNALSLHVFANRPKICLQIKNRYFDRGKKSAKLAIFVKKNYSFAHFWHTLHDF